ncbi:Nitrile hydratase, beta subunit [Sulfitobacter noctilucae]|uniref:nitrile hydratase subunit beta n=1 Tax=Sulfitobacter noctilucae TaxID=1342302 RepID=UPI00046A5F46|nr:nitrile hydratase subunit beta [Sulfitobacter noctilucae]KIN61620.1 Nitrile hydratase, beta subunit [Sulfitobacter noctilucae]
MSRLHDMGGRFGDGAVVPEAEDVIFHADWHPRALALTLAAGGLGQWNIDSSRHARERLKPTDYARFSYYEKWMGGLATLLVEAGIVTREELAGKAAPALSPLAERVLRANQVADVLAKGGPAERPSNIAPSFAPGDTVVAKQFAENTKISGGHTRLPGYAAGARGRVLRLHGSHILPDSHAHGTGEAPEPLYAVAFAASELWAHPEHPRDEVIVDMWQSYLKAAS